VRHRNLCLGCDNSFDGPDGHSQRDVDLVRPDIGQQLLQRGTLERSAGEGAIVVAAKATDATWQSYFAAFIQGLRQLGWIEGQNLRIDTRWSAGDAALARIYAAQLIGLMPDVILTTPSPLAR
jgi:hypothetical protein